MGQRAGEAGGMNTMERTWSAFFYLSSLENWDMHLYHLPWIIDLRTRSEVCII